MHTDKMVCAVEEQLGWETATEDTRPDTSLIGGIFSTAAEAKPVVEALATAMSKHGYRDQDRFAAQLALEEAIAKAIKHGSKYDSTTQIRLEYEVTGRRLFVTVTDRGNGSDPDRVIQHSPKTWKEARGRWLMLMREFVT